MPDRAFDLKNIRQSGNRLAKLDQLQDDVAGESQKNALTTLDDGSTKLGSYVVTALGLKTHSTNEGEWLELGRFVKRLTGSLQWVVGDWLVDGNTQWGKTYEQACALTGLAYDTVKDYAYVCRNVQLSVRTDKLDFSHHKLVADMEPGLQAEWLKYAIDERMSVARMRAAISPQPDVEPTEAEKVDNRIKYIKRNIIKLPGLSLKKRKDFALEARALGEYLIQLATWAETEQD